MPDFTDDPVISNTSNVNAVEGVSVDGRGLVGKSDTNYGIRGHSNKIAGIRGSSEESRGVEGWATKSEGVVGISKTGTGVWGQTEGAGIGVAGSSKTGVGVQGRSTDGRGVEGWSETQYGVAGESKKSAGVRGTSADGRGVEGWSTNWEGVVGLSINSAGVWGQTDGQGNGIQGTSKFGVGVFGKGGRLAGLFEGNVQITESLIVRDTDVIAFIQQLQKRIADLEELVKATLPPLARISVQQISSASGGTAPFLISGTGFRANVFVNVDVSGNVFRTDGEGTLNSQISVSCVAGNHLSITVFDPNHPKGRQSSNTVTIICT